MRAHDDRDLPCCRTGARLASRAAGWRAEFAPCGCEQVISSSPRAPAGEVEESVAKEQDCRFIGNASATRAAAMRPAGPGWERLLLCFSVSMD